MPTELATKVAKRASTGSERTPTGSDKTPCSAPTRVTTTTAPSIAQEHPVTRQKEYRFADEPAPRHADLARTAQALVSHDVPPRRHTVISHHRLQLGPQVHSVNTLTAPIPPFDNAPDGAGGSLRCTGRLAIGVGFSAISRAVLSSDVAPYPRDNSEKPSTWIADFALSRFFTRESTTPARRDAVADEVDKELLLATHDAIALGREFAWLSSEIREFLKNKDESGEKGETWARLAEMAGFAIGGFGSPRRVLGRVLITASAKPQRYAILIRIRAPFWVAFCVSPSETLPPILPPRRSGVPSIPRNVSKIRLHWPTVSLARTNRTNLLIRKDRNSNRGGATSHSGHVCQGGKQHLELTALFLGANAVRNDSERIQAPANFARPNQTFPRYIS